MRTRLVAATILAATTAGAEEHVVREGETLGSLARAYYGETEIGPAVLATANGLGDPEQATISAGQRLVVPVPRHVTVGEGETWEGLAERTLGSPRRAAFLARANGAEPDVTPDAGAEIVVPVVVAHRPERRETLAAIAKRWLGGERTGARVVREFNDLRPGRPPEDRPVLVPLASLRLTSEGTEALARDAAGRGDGSRARAQAEIAEALPDLDRLFREGKYTELVAAANRLLGRTEATGNQLVTIHRMLAYGYVAIDREDLSEASFREALARQPDLELNPITTSPKILRVFRRARESRTPP